MFYVRENWLGSFRERLTRAILQVPQQHAEAITPLLVSTSLLEATALQTHWRPRFRPHWQLVFLVITKTGVTIQGREATNLLMQTICETLAMKQPAVRGSAGRKTGTMLRLKKPRYRLKHSATVLRGKGIALMDGCIGHS